MTEIVGWHLNPEEHRCHQCGKPASCILYDEDSGYQWDACNDCAGNAPDGVAKVLIPALERAVEKLKREMEEKSQPPRD